MNSRDDRIRRHHIAKISSLQVWLLILLLAPIASFLLSNLLKKLAPVLSTGIIGLTTILSICLAFNHWQIEPTLIKGNWFKIGTSQLTYAMMIDQLMLIMTVVVNFISFLVHFFSIEYMRKDKRRPLYFAFLGVFTFSIMGIVLFHDLLLMFVFWELVGLSSYLLIGFWFEKKSASKAANKAFIVNRIGDLGFITGLMILFYPIPNIRP